MDAITTWDGRFPKQFDNPEHEQLIREYLNRHMRPLRIDAPIQLPWIPLDEPLSQALGYGFQNRSLLPGIDPAEMHLEKERQGLLKLTRMDSTAAPRRISRLLLITRDGSDRFLRRVVKLLLDNQPRLAGLVIDASADTLSRILKGSTGGIKCLMANDKQAVMLILSAVGRSCGR